MDQYIRESQRVNFLCVFFIFKMYVYFLGSKKLFLNMKNISANKIKLIHQALPKQLNGLKLSSMYSNQIFDSYLS